MEKTVSSKKPIRKRLLTALGVMALLCVAGVIYVLCVNWHIKASASPYIFDRSVTASADSLPEADCIMVLGCGVDDDGNPKLLLRDRLDCGVELYQNGAAPKLLMSGDHGRVAYDEVNSMKNTPWSSA